MPPDEQPLFPSPPVGGSRTASQVWLAPSIGEIQSSLPQYEVIGLLGRGGMGAVYKARQKSLKRLVAIKILARDGGDDEMRFAERFQHEALAMARLNHPNIVNVHDAGETADGLLYLVMEHVEGCDLAQLIAQRGRMPQAEVKAIALQVAEALAYAHANGIVHRDIKPANILLTEVGQVKVADFGLAKASEPLVSTLLTKSGTSMGTADFMAPETRKTGMADVRSDVFSLGVTLYQLLTGELPQGMFKLPSELHPELDTRWDEIICKALEPRPADRYQSVEALKQDLARIGESEAVVEKVPLAQTTKRAGRLAYAFVVLVLLMGGAAWMVMQPKQPPAVSATAFDLAAFTKEMAEADVEAKWALLKNKLDELNGSDVTILRKEEDKQRGRITYLGISNNARPLKDIRPVAAIPEVVSLFFHDVWLEDISCLKGTRLEQLGIFQSRLTDLSVLETLPSLWSLNLANATGIRDFTPLRKLKLGVLFLNTNPQLKDISFVKGMPVRVLNIRDTGVRDLSPLAGMGIEELECNADIPITAELLRSLPKLQKINGQPVTGTTLGGPGSQPLTAATPARPFTAGNKLPPGQWVRLFTSIDDIPADLRKPDSGVKFEKGWIVPERGRRFYLHIGKVGVSSNCAIRMRFRPRDAFGEETNLSELRLRAGKTGSYCFNATAAKGYLMRLVRTDDGKERREVLASATLSPQVPETGTPQITFGVVGSKLIARSEDHLLLAQEDASFKFGEMEFMNTQAAVGEIEIVQLDGLSEKEALRILGVDENGNDIQASPPRLDAKLASEPTGRIIDLMPLIDVQRDAIAGEWRMDNGRLVASKAGEGPGTGFPRLELPYAPPAEYDFEVEFEVAGEGSGVYEILSAQGRSFSWVTGVRLAAGFKSGFDMIEGQTVMSRLDGTVMRADDFLHAGRRHVMKVEVRSTTLRGFLDGEQLVHWGKSAEAFRLLDIPPRLALRKVERLGLATDNRAVTFHRVMVREVKGEGTNESAPSSAPKAVAVWRDWLTPKLKRGDFASDGWLREEEGVTTDTDIRGTNMISDNVSDCAARLTYDLRSSEGIQITLRERKGPAGEREIYFADDTGRSLYIGRMLPDRSMVKLMNKEYVPDPTMKGPRVLEFRGEGNRLTATLKGATKDDLTITAVDGVLDKGPCALVMKKGALLRKAEVMELPPQPMQSQPAPTSPIK